MVEDPDLDAYSCHLVNTYPDGSSSEGNISLASQSSITVAYIMLRSAPAAPYGTYQISVIIMDEKGNTSDTFRVNYSVVAP